MGDIQQNYLTKVDAFNAHLEDRWTVQVELRYLAMYFIDGLIKHTRGRGWPDHREALATGFYAACYRTCSPEDVEHQDEFMMELFARQCYYNDGLSESIDYLSKISDAQARIGETTKIVALSFAKQCGHPDNPHYTLIGAGATTAIYIATETLFSIRIGQLRRARVAIVRFSTRHQR